MSGFTKQIPEGFRFLSQESIISDLRDARVQAGISSEEAAKTLGLSREVFDDVEAGRIALNLTDIRAYAYAVDAVIEYSVTETSSTE